MVIVAAIGQFGVQPILDGLRAQALPRQVMESVLRDRFATWHGVASVLYLIECALGVALVWLQPARRTSRPRLSRARVSDRHSVSAEPELFRDHGWFRAGRREGAGSRSCVAPSREYGRDNRLVAFARRTRRPCTRRRRRGSARRLASGWRRRRAGGGSAGFSR